MNSVQNLLTHKLADVTFAVVDLETTGFSMNGDDRICEIAIVWGKFGQEKPLKTWSKLINPGRQIPYSAIRIHNISNQMVENQPLFQEVAPEILDLLENCVLIFHNRDFDYPFLQVELTRAGVDISRLPETYLDTLLLARCNYNFDSNKLGDLIDQIGLTDTANPDHRALNDTMATWQLFCWLISDLGLRYKFEFVHELAKLQKSKTLKKAMTAKTVKIQSEQVVKVDTEQDSSGYHIHTQVQTETTTSYEFFQITEQASNVFNQWNNGQLPIEAALPLICNHFAQLDDMSKILDEQLKALREQITQMMHLVGGKAEIPQFGKLQLVEPQTVTSFDRKRLETLVADLEALGNNTLAQAIADCKTSSNRSGSLKITRTKLS